MYSRIPEITGHELEEGETERERPWRPEFALSLRGLAIVEWCIKTLVISCVSALLTVGIMYLGNACIEAVTK
jgi:hypothetical protein